MSLEKELNQTVVLLRFSLTADGAGLFCAVLEYFLKLGGERPKVLMVSQPLKHLYIGYALSWYCRRGLNLRSEILQGGFIEQTPYLQYAHMEVLLPEDQQSDELIFLY